MPRRSKILWLLGAIALSGCYRWEPVTTISPREAVEQLEPTLMRVVVDQTQPFVLLQRPIVSEDSIRGLVNTRSGAGTLSSTRSIALQDVRRIEVRRINAWTTAGAVLVGASVVGGVIFLLAFAECDSLFTGC